MRTTLTLDPDVTEMLRVRISEEKATMKQVVNEALRRGLSAGPGPRPKKRFRVVPFSLGFQPGIDQDKLNQLVDELEVQEFAAKFSKKQS